MRKLYVLVLFTAYILGCENRDINEGEEFRPREVNDSFNDVTFSKVTVDGIEYLMLERDNNNPHEGFGFMAFRANALMEKQDSVVAHLKTISEMQSRMYARLFNVQQEVADSLYRERFDYYLEMEQEDLYRLEKEVLSNRDEGPQ